MRSLKQLLRHIPLFSKFENQGLTLELEEKTIKIKEEKSESLYKDYYVPLAQNYFLNRDNLLYPKDDKLVHNKAMNMFFDDLHNKKLDEFYNFV